MNQKMEKEQINECILNQVLWRINYIENINDKIFRKAFLIKNYQINLNSWNEMHVHSLHHQNINEEMHIVDDVSIVGYFIYFQSDNSKYVVVPDHKFKLVEPKLYKGKNVKLLHFIHTFNGKDKTERRTIFYIQDVH